MAYCVTSGNGEQSANYEYANVGKLKGTTQVTTLHVLTLRLLMSYIQGVPGGKDLTSGECSLGQTIPI